MLDWLSPLATLLASFLGAWFAFRLQDLARLSETRAAQVEAANSVIFSVAQMLNSLKIFQLDYIEPHRNDPGISYSMLPLYGPAELNIKMNYSSLGYLLDPEHGQIVMELFIQQQRYDEAIRLINYRSELHLNSVQPILEKSGFTPGKEYSIEEFRAALGVLIAAKIEQATAHVVQQVDNTISTLEETKNGLRSILKSMYPDYNFIDFVVAPPEEQKSNAQA